MEQDPTLLLLMYFVVPVWLMAGFADWLCHRATNIEITSGAKESVIHLLLFAEVRGPLAGGQRARDRLYDRDVLRSRGDDALGFELCGYVAENHAH